MPRDVTDSAAGSYGRAYLPSLGGGPGWRDYTALLVAAVSLMSCGGDGSGGGGPSPDAFSGVYGGTANLEVQFPDFGRSIYGASFTLILNQSGTRVSGQWGIDQFSGTLTGTLEGQTTSLALTQNAPCPGTLIGTMDVVTLQGNLSGTSCGAPVTVALTDGARLAGVTGEWAGTAVIPGCCSAELTMWLEQGGTDLDGGWSLSTGEAGALNGTVTANMISLALTQTDPCAGSYTGTGQLRNDGTITGSVSGDYCGFTVSWTFTVARRLAYVSPVIVEGLYRGTLTGSIGGQAGSAPISATMVQSGTDVTITWSAEPSASGSGQGTVSGSTLDFSLTMTAPCLGSYSGSAWILFGGDILTGHLNGSDCGGAATGDIAVLRR